MEFDKEDHLKKPLSSPLKGLIYLKSRAFEKAILWRINGNGGQLIRIHMGAFAMDFTARIKGPFVSSGNKTDISHKNTTYPFLYNRAFILIDHFIFGL